MAQELRKGEESKMARYTGPKRRLSRREGVALFGKDVKQIKKKGQRAKKRRRV